MAFNNPVYFVDIYGLAVGDWWDLPANHRRAQEIASEEIAKRPGAHNNQEDGMRHAEWSRRTACETNPFTAWYAGIGHELENLWHGSPWNEVKMDIHNNAEGRNAAHENREVNPENLVTNPNNLTTGNPDSNVGYF